MLPSIEHRIAAELSVATKQVAAAVQLLDDGATVPFIARYRKEATDGLDDTHLRTLLERLSYLRELEERRKSVIASVHEQEKMTSVLLLAFQNADTKQQLEDLYLPYKPRRRTKAQIAREAGLEPLADALFADPTLNPEDEAAKYINLEKEPDKAQVTDIKAALDGARQILIERFAENAQLLERLRNVLKTQGKIVSKVIAGKEEIGVKFRDWFDFQEPIATIPSHRALAIFRARNEGIVRVSLKTPIELSENPEPSPCEAMVAGFFALKMQGRAADKWLLESARLAWLVKLSLHLELELMSAMRTRADEEAIQVFARNLHDLLLAAPAGPLVTMGLDPGIRTGVKIAVVDKTGKVVDSATIYPHEPRLDWDGSLATLGGLCLKHNIDLIAIGNGTASRETDKLSAELIKLLVQHDGRKVAKIVVSEAGASVYSASELAAKEFPDLDVSIRGAVSIARRLQDPLAELVKIDPKSIGVGQYQHDVNQMRLVKSLDAVVEDCVNAVGVDVNTASAALLAHVSGLNTTHAENIVSYRDNNGAFVNREQLKNVPRLGEKCFEQAAGFLRVNNGNNPLDASAVHPESYPLVEKILADIGKQAKALMNNPTLLKTIHIEKYADETFGLPTIRDILTELEKPGRDPRPAFKTATFRDGIEELKDLSLGMTLEGIITNVTNFGAFVDIGVHQDGLVHISALSKQFVKDPHTVVKAGDVVFVKVLEIDVIRKRIALSMRLSDEPTARQMDNKNVNDNGKRQQKTPPYTAPATEQGLGTLAQAFAKLKEKA